MKAFETKKYDFCGQLQSGHYCQIELFGNNWYLNIHGSEYIQCCGKAVCVLCRESWGNAEDYQKICVDCKKKEDNNTTQNQYVLLEESLAKKKLTKTKRTPPLKYVKGSKGKKKKTIQPLSCRSKRAVSNK